MCCFIPGRPCPPFCLLLADASGFVAFLDVLGLSLLLVCVAGFVSAWHHDLLWQISISLSSYSTPAFLRISAISLDASALVRSFRSVKGWRACSDRVCRKDAWASVIGSSPDTQSSGSF